MTTHIVTNTADSGPGSLREAVAIAINGDRIHFDLGEDSVIVLTSGEIVIDKDLVIDGEDSSIIITSNGLHRFSTVAHQAQVILKNLIFDQCAFTRDDGTGGAIFAGENGFLQLIKCTFRNNEAKLGGAVFIQGQQKVNFINCRFFNNLATEHGGAVTGGENSGLNFVNCLFYNNQSAISGGAIWLDTQRPSRIINSTIAGNTAGSEGGGLYLNNGSATLLLQNSIVAENSAADGPDLFARSNLEASGNLIGNSRESSLTIGQNNNISGEAHFVDRQAGNLHLRDISPANGTANIELLLDINDIDDDGDFQELMGVGSDLDGNDIESTCGFDMGAFQNDGQNLFVINAEDNGVGSLRAAMECINSHPQALAIRFFIPGEGIHTITPESELPTLANAGSTLDGTTQPGYEDRPLIFINGENAPGLGPIRMAAENITVKGLMIKNFRNSAIRGESGAVIEDCIITDNDSYQILLLNINGVTVRNNRIGIDENGRRNSYDQTAIVLQSTSNSIVNSNIIGGRSNSNEYLLIIGDASNNNIVEDNFIGTDTNGSVDYGGLEGIRFNGSFNNTVRNNVIAFHQTGIINDFTSANNRFTENDFSCNTAFGILLSDNTNDNIKPPVITNFLTSIIEGNNARSNARVELYLQNSSSCPNAGCQGSFIGAATADSNGNWQFPNTVAPAGAVITALQIDPNGHTSAFSNCVTIQSCTLVFTSETIDPTSCTAEDGQILLQGLMPDETYNIAVKPDGMPTDQVIVTANSTGQLQVTNLADGSYDIQVSQTGSGCVSEPASIVLNAPAPPDRQAAASGDLTDCDGSAALFGNLSEDDTGRWFTLSGAAFADSNAPSTTATGLQIGENIFIWQLSNADCPNYDADTLIIFYEGMPKATEDAFTTAFENTIPEVNVLVNDELALIDDWSVSIIEQPPAEAGRLEETGPGRYQFFPFADRQNSGTASFVGTTSFTYRLRSNTSGCEDRATVTIRVEPPTNLPTGITPNGDGVNDQFVIEETLNQRCPGNELTIFNQWGDAVFHATDYNNDWDGRNTNGQQLPQATYYYIFQCNGQIRKGRVVILRDKE